MTSGIKYCVRVSELVFLFFTRYHTKLSVLIGTTPALQLLAHLIDVDEINVELSEQIEELQHHSLR